MPAADYLIPLEKLSTAEVDGTGVFDVLMKSVNAHIDREFKTGRIKGPEYSTVYLGALESTLRTSVEFLLQQNKAALEAANLEAQLALTEAQIDLVNAQADKARAEADMMPKQEALIDAQIAKITAENTLIPKQGLRIDAEKDLITGQATKVNSDKLLVDQQKTNLVAEALNIPKQGQRLDAEKELLVQKKVTETAQTSNTGVAVDSVIGKQKALYDAQAQGFQRDAEQKAAKLMIDTWNVRRTTDEATIPSSTNKLDDATLGKMVTKMLAGVSVVA